MPLSGLLQSRVRSVWRNHSARTLTSSARFLSGWGHNKALVMGLECTGLMRKQGPVRSNWSAPSTSAAAAAAAAAEGLQPKKKRRARAPATTHRYSYPPFCLRKRRLRHARFVRHFREVRGSHDTALSPEWSASRPLSSVVPRLAEGRAVRARAVASTLLADAVGGAGVGGPGVEERSSFGVLTHFWFGHF